MASRMTNRDLLAVRAFVTGQDAVQYDAVHTDTVIVDVTHSNLQQRHLEIRLSKHATLDVLRQKIHQQTGTPASFQHLQIFESSDRTGPSTAEIPPETPDTYKIGYFLQTHGLTLHCVDLNPHSISSSGALENVNLVQKYRLSDEQYDAKDKTLRSWKKEKLKDDPTFTLQRHAAEHSQLQEAIKLHKRGLSLPSGFVVQNGEVTRDTSSPSEEYGPESIAHAQLGQRCQINAGLRRGSIAWTGQLGSAMEGFWVGILLDEPTGKNDGSLQGKHYFDAPEKHGVFVRGKHVDVGDYPVRDIFDEDSSDEEL